MEIPVKPGETYTGALAISNESDQETTVRSEILDFWIDDDQEPQFRPVVPEQQDSSCRTWVKVNPAEFTLSGKQKKTIRYTLYFPKELHDGSYNCAIGFTGMPPASAESTGVVTNVRLVTALYAVAGRPTPAGRVTAIQILPGPQDGGGKRQAAAFLENTGTTYFRPLGTLAVLNASGGVVESLPFRSLPVLPGKTQRFVFPLQSGYEPGQKIKAHLDIGGADIQEVLVSVKPEQPLP